MIDQDATWYCLHIPLLGDCAGSAIGALLQGNGLVLKNSVKLL